jgi:putative hydroxymethylpyrimidine transport system substrate-binding protein
MGVLLVMLAWPAFPVTLHVGLDYFSNPNHIPLYVALNNGYFADEGLDVDIFVPANPSDPVKLAAARAIEIALTPQINYLIARSEGLPLMAVGALIDHPLGGLVALGSRGIESLEDLAWHRIGYALAPLEPILWETVLSCAGVDLSGLEMVNVGYNTVTALITNNVDAIGAFRNYEVLQLEELGYDPVFFPQEEFCVPRTYELILVAHPDVVAEQGKAVSGFLTALSRGIDWTIEHPDDALSLFFDRFPDLDDELNRRSFERTLPLYAIGANHADEQVWDVLQAYLVEQGLMAVGFPMNELYTATLLPRE